MFAKAARNRALFRVNPLAAEIEECLVPQMTELELFRHGLRVKLNGGEVKAESGKFDGGVADVETGELPVQNLADGFGIRAMPSGFAAMRKR